MTWRKTFEQDLERVNISLEEVVDVAINCLQWRKAAARCAEMHGRNYTVSRSKFNAYFTWLHELT